jgi:hypothetical protein
MLRILFLFLIPAVISTVFQKTQHSKKRGTYLLIVWIAVVFFMSLAGALVWKPFDDCTRVASIVFAASPVLLLGPRLLCLRKKSIPLIWLCVITAITPVVSCFGAFFALCAMQQAWGM